MEMERTVVEKVGHVIASIEVAKHVDEIIVALYSLAACLFPLQPHTLSGTIDEKYRHQLSDLVVPSPEERTEWFNIFYKGSGFLAFSRVLLYDVASNWLACFPICARKCVYDVFFLNGYATEVVQVLVPCLHQGHHDITVCSNAERLIILCLLENDMVLQMAREFMVECHIDDISHEKLKQNITRIAQLITSIPDKARRGAPVSLSPPFFFKRITTYVLRIEEEYDLELVHKSAVANVSHLSGLILFVGEIFARICRRGSTDVLLSEVIPRILEHVRGVLSSNADLAISQMFESKSCFRFWSSIIEAVNDSHSVERIAEGLLNQLADENVSDLESYWTLWILFGQICKRQTSIRFIFVEKFLLWKVFPVCCLRWILHFAVLECSPDNFAEKHSYSTCSLLETVHRLVVVWSNKEFVQSAPAERQTYLTAALGLCLGKMTKEDLNATKGALPSILQGISCRLESPVYLIRKMASCIALVFSKIIDPEHPLYLDDSCEEDPIDWEFGLATPSNRCRTRPPCLDHKPDEMENSTILDATHKRSNGVGKAIKSEVNINLLDPDEVIDPATLIEELTFGGDDSDVESEDSGISIDSSLEPYDLADDDTDLKRKFSQLVDVVGALRKSDDAEGVESALDVAETLIRALPDELKYIASDLAKILVQVRCSEATIEGDEDSAEDKRQKALVALVVACPVETLDSLNKLIYSSSLDISQRIMILDVMTESAQELACTKIIKKPEQYQKPLITSTSDQPWFVPRNTGPSGAGPWKEISSSGNPLNWSYTYERELPSREGMGKKGKTRRWRNRIKGNEVEWSQNNFPPYAAAFMLPFMREFDKKRHGVDLLGRDFIVLGKLIYMLGVCMKCAAMHPEASVLASALLDMLRSREICHHKEAYVRRSVLFAASCVLLALHPSYVASAVVEGNVEVSQGLDWVRAWALQIAESDTDRECHSLAMACLQLHTEMALQASRAMESANDGPISATKTLNLFPRVSNRSSIKMPFLDS